MKIYLAILLWTPQIEMRSFSTVERKCDVEEATQWNFRTARTPKQEEYSPAVRADEELGFAGVEGLLHRKGYWG